jgi:hypothetical protein
MRRRVEEVLECSDVVVVTKRSDEYREALSNAGQRPIVIDLARVVEGAVSDERYHGIAW